MNPAKEEKTGEELLPQAIELMRRKAKRIENAQQLISYVQQDVRMASMDEKERDFVVNQLENILKNVLVNDDKDENKWNSKRLMKTRGGWRKYRTYFSYVFRHKWYVFLGCCRYGLFWQGIIHDWTKLLPSEFIPYANFLYGDKKDKAAYDKAWLHHQKRNKHHWEWWVTVKKGGEIAAILMPDRYRKEMVADWRGVGLSAKGYDESREYYMVNREVIILHDDTRKWVEKELGVTK